MMTKRQQHFRRVRIAGQLARTASPAPGAFYVEAQGSLIGMELQEGNPLQRGDLLLVDPSKPVRDSNVVLVETVQGWTVARVVRKGRQVKLHPILPHHPRTCLVFDRQAQRPRCYRITQHVRDY